MARALRSAVQFVNLCKLRRDLERFERTQWPAATLLQRQAARPWQLGVLSRW